MKQFFFLIVIVIISNSTAIAQVGINTDGSQPDPSAMLDVKSSVKGLLPPRVALTAINVADPVISPAIGLHVYNTAISGTSPNNVIPGNYFWNGSRWVSVSLPQGANTGDLLYWNGVQYMNIPVGLPGQFLQLSTASTPTWVGTAYPAVTTSGITAITTTTAISGGNVTSDGGASVTSKGVCWNTSANPAIADNIAVTGSGTGSFSSSLTGLLPSTIYYVRAFATNSAGTAYGNEFSFTTNCASITPTFDQIGPLCLNSTALSLPASSTNIPPITGTWSPATISTEAVGSFSYIFTPDEGQCATQTTLDIVVISVAPTIVISSDLNSICTGTTITFNAIVTGQGASPAYQWFVNGVLVGNNAAYSSNTFANNDVVSCILNSSDPCANPVSVTSNLVTITVNPAVLPTISITADLNPVCAGTFITLTATATNGGASPVYQWNVNGLNAGTNNHVFQYLPANGDIITCQLTSSLNCVSPNPTLSNAISMTVNPPPLSPAAGNHVPSLTQIVWKWIAVPGATGYRWSTENDFSNAIDLDLSLLIVETGLTCNTNYTRYLWSYNECGNSVVTTLTKSTSGTSVNAPTTSTHAPSTTQIVWNWNTVSGASGYKWSTTNNYATAIEMGINLAKTETGLTCNTPYSRFIWAYATCGNSIATTLTQSTSTCPILPTVTTTAVTNVTQSSSTSGGNVTSDGGSTVTFRGVCWSILPNPTIVDNHSTDGTGTGSFTSSLTGLTPNTLYYLRAYATNTAGTSYGNELAFTTNCASFVAVSVSITPSVNPVCPGAAVTFTAIPVNGGSAPLYQWKVNGLDYSGATNATFSYTPAAMCMVTCILTSSGTCITGNPATSNTIYENVSNILTPPTSGTHNSLTTQIIWNWDAVSEATGYKWSNTNNYANATDMGTATTKTETGLTCNTSYTRYIWAYNECENTTQTTLTQTSAACIFPCGSNITVNHVAGAVCPITKTVTYGTVINIPGEPDKCWITSNLGSDHQATSVNDATEASAGWYWQFNRKQGYKHDGTFLTPSWTSTSISENLNWQAANDPCTIELGTDWRIPSSTEWANVVEIGVWTNWDGPWNSNLKLHAAGRLYPSGGLTGRGSFGFYFANNQYFESEGWHLEFFMGGSEILSSDKASGFPLRCLMDTCSVVPTSPTVGNHIPSSNQIIWNWNNVPDALGYKWNTIYDYASATDLLTTTKTETGLICNTNYTRFIWAYNECGYSAETTISKSTLSCPTVPTLATTTITNISSTTAVSGGIVLTDGGAPVIFRGVCWSTIPNPTIADSHTTDGNGIGIFVSNLTNMIVTTQYYVRAYAVNNIGTSYGNELIFTAAYGIGENYEGGKIFYIDETGLHGLISATFDQSTGAQWGCNTTFIPGISSAIGTGQANTTAIVNGCSQAAIAARICNDLVLNGYSDWFLPSKDELNQMYLQKNIIGGFANGSYWSSSDYNAGNAWLQSFYYGNSDPVYKHYTYYVRAVRAY